MQIAEVMSGGVISVGPDATLREVAATMARHGVSGLPVVHAGRVLGIVSEADVLLKEQGLASESSALAVLSELDAIEIEQKLAARTAAEAMTSPAIAVAPSASVAHAARLMAERGVNRLAVVEDGTLVGIVTRADLVRAFARSDDQIREDVVEDVLRRVPGVETARVGIRVLHGEVELSGSVPSEEAIDRVVEQTSEVPGVVSVHSALRVAARA